MPKSNDNLYRKKPGGTWYGWYRLANGTSKYTCLHTKDSKVARERLRALERDAPAEAHRAADTPKRPVLLVNAFEAWFAEADDRLSAASMRMYTQKARHVLRVLGSETEINAITREQVLEYTKIRKGEGAHAGMIYKEVVALRQAFKHAFDTGRLATDPRALIPQVRNKYEPRRKFLTEAQFVALWEALPPRRAWWLAVAVFSGARRSEIEAIRVEEHLDLAGAWLRIPGTKTQGSARTIPLNPFLLDLFEQYAPKEGPLVQPWENVNRDLAAACERSNVPRVSPNDLCRTFASWLKQRGEDSLVVARLLGHKSTTMVERVYGHLGNDNLRRAVDRLPTPQIDPSVGSAWVVKTSPTEPNHPRMTNRATKKPLAFKGFAVSPAGFEPATRGLKGRGVGDVSPLHRLIKPRTKRVG